MDTCIPGNAPGEPRLGQRRTPEMSYRYVYVYGIKNGQVIFVRKKGRNTWELPGGKIEPGETPEETAGREFLEETGYNIDIIQSVETDESEKLAFIGKIGDKMTGYDEREIEEIKLFNCEQIPDKDILSFPYTAYEKILADINGYIDQSRFQDIAQQRRE
jgi:8-oxo-dGTP diphosphatase